MPENRKDPLTDSKLKVLSEAPRNDVADTGETIAVKEMAPRQSCPSDGALPGVGRQLVGTVMAGHYRITDLIGSGGMSTVFRATDVSLNREVAVKLLLPQLRVHKHSLMRFQQEGKALSKLDHRNIVRVFELGVHDDSVPYMVMEYIVGSSLSMLLDREHTLSVARTVDIIGQICDALEHAHAQRVVHRDLKTSNIMSTEDEQLGAVVKIVDFGIAKIVTESSLQNLTETGEIFGSPLYMSPEQCTGKHVDKRADIYALGCIMYECLTGLPPHVGDTPLLTLMKHQQSKPLTLKEATLGGPFPDELERIVARMLEKRPQDRYQCAEELNFDLDRFRSGDISGNPWTEGAPPPGQDFFRDVNVAHLANLQKLELSVFGRSDPRRERRKQILLYAPLCFTILLLASLASYNLFRAEPVLDQSSLEAPVKTFNPDVYLQSYTSERPYLQQAIASSNGIALDAKYCRVISGKEWKLIEKLPKLETINLACTDVSDDGLQHLSNLPLRLIDLKECDHIHGAGLRHLETMPTLIAFHAEQSSIRDADLAHLNTNVTDLEISRCHITDAGLRHLLRLKSLTKLSIRFSPITDAGLDTIRQMRNLDWLDIKACDQLSAPAINKLIQDMPHCVVITYAERPR